MKYIFLITILFQTIFAEDVPFSKTDSGITSNYFDAPGIYLINSSTDWGNYLALETRPQDFPSSLSIDFSGNSVILLSKNTGPGMRHELNSINESSGNVTINSTTYQRKPGLYPSVIVTYHELVTTPRLSGNIIELNKYIPYISTDENIKINEDSPTEVDSTESSINSSSGGGCLLKTNSNKPMLRTRNRPSDWKR